MEFTKRRLEDAHAIVRLNTSQKLFPRGFFGLLQMMMLTSLHKLAPKIFRPYVDLLIMLIYELYIIPTVCYYLVLALANTNYATTGTAFLT